MRLNKKVLEALTEKVQEQMKGYTWNTIKYVDIINDWYYPMSWTTLYKLIRQPKYYSAKQTKALLKYYSIPFEVVDDVILLVI
jgi:hypothetical protein